MLPSSRTRAHLVADYLRAHGYATESHHIKTRAITELSIDRFRELLRNTRLLASLRRDDILYLHKMIYQADFMLLVLMRKILFRRGYIFDFDDAIWLDKGHAAAFKTRLMLRHADLVVAGSHFIQEYALTYNPNSHVMTSLMDTETVYRVADRLENKVPIIGWTGTPVHYENMQLLIGPLQHLVAEGYRIQFLQLGGGRRICDLLQSVEGLTVTYLDNLPWDKPAEIVKYMQRFDIGVMPLQKTEWNRGKDTWKAKEYMACGVATILSDWGENPYVVRQGEDGILVDSAEEWYAAFKRLLDDPAYRRELGLRGRKRMEATCSYASFVPSLEHLLGRSITRVA